MSATFSLLRLAVVVLVCTTSLTAAQGLFLTCPTANSTIDYTVAQGCSAYQACASTRCTCAGGKVDTTASNNCSYTTRPTCAVAQGCFAAFASCVATAASATGTCLSNFKLGLLELASGASFNNSGLYASCANQACLYLNDTISTNCTSVAYGDYCPTPVTTTPAPATPIPDGGNLIRVVLVLDGDWTAVLANATALARLKGALKVDIELKLGYVVIIVTLRAGSLIVEFDAKAAANDATFATKLSTLATDASWLTSTKATFTESGGKGTFGVLGISTTTPAPTKTGAAYPVLAWTAILAALAAMIFA